MKDLTILVTASGAPGCSTLIRYLRSIIERDIKIIAVDMEAEPIGRFLADKFYQIVPANHKDYICSLRDIIKYHEVDILFCVSSAEIEIVSQYKELLENTGCKVVVSDYNSIKRASNKFELYSTCKKIGIPTPNFRAPRTLEDFIEEATAMGYPDKELCFKPFVAKGGRGFRILSEKIDRKDLLLNHKPNSVYMSLDEFIQIFKNDKELPELLLMEKVEGPEYDTMVVANKGEALLTTIKTREKARWGVITVGELINNEQIEEYCSKIIKEFNLSYNISIQFKGNYIIEVNPRTSTYIYASDFIEPYMAIKLALGEISNEEVKEHISKIPIGRRMLRYMDQLFFNDEIVDYGPR